MTKQDGELFHVRFPVIEPNLIFLLFKITVQVVVGPINSQALKYVLLTTIVILLLLPHHHFLAFYQSRQKLVICSIDFCLGDLAPQSEPSSTTLPWIRPTRGQKDVCGLQSKFFGIGGIISVCPHWTANFPEMYNPPTYRFE